MAVNPLDAMLILVNLPKTNTANGYKKKKKAKKNTKPYRRMIIEAISKIRHGGKGVSRAKIAAYLKKESEVKLTGGAFNSHLRKVLSDGLNNGILVKGATSQRYKLTDLGKRERKEKNYYKKLKQTSQNLGEGSDWGDTSDTEDLLFLKSLGITNLGAIPLSALDYEPIEDTKPSDEDEESNGELNDKIELFLNRYFDETREQQQQLANKNK